MKKVAFVFIFICFLLNGYTQDFKININKLTEETQQLSESPDKLQLVWWIPLDFWKAIFEEDKSMPKDQVNAMLNHLEKYTMIVAIDGDISASGDISYRSEEEVFEKLKIVDDKKEKYTPLLHDEIDLDTQQLINIVKPVLSQMLGKVGENMHFFLFQKRNNPLDKIVDPLISKTFEVKLAADSFKWDLPLSSLLKPKKCSVDNKYLDGTFKYCPYHGNKLASR